MKESRRIGFRLRQEPGLTLIEILLVLVILGVIAAVAVPNFTQSFRQTELEGAADNIAYLMRYAQSRAVTQEKNVRLVFDEPSRKYWLEEADRGLSQAEYHRVTGMLAKTGDVPEDISLGMSQPTVAFQPDGTIEKIWISLCREKMCLTISTQEQRGFINIFSNENQ